MNALEKFQAMTNRKKRGWSLVGVMTLVTILLSLHYITDTMHHGQSFSLYSILWAICDHRYRGQMAIFFLCWAVSLFYFFGDEKQTPTK